MYIQMSKICNYNHSIIKDNYSSSFQQPRHNVYHKFWFSGARQMIETTVNKKRDIWIIWDRIKVGREGIHDDYDLPLVGDGLSRRDGK